MLYSFRRRSGCPGTGQPLQQSQQRRLSAAFYPSRVSVPSRLIPCVVPHRGFSLPHSWPLLPTSAAEVMPPATHAHCCDFCLCHHSCGGHTQLLVSLLPLPHLPSLLHRQPLLWLLHSMLPVSVCLIHDEGQTRQEKKKALRRSLILQHHGQWQGDERGLAHGVCPGAC